LDLKESIGSIIPTSCRHNSVQEHTRSRQKPRSLGLYTNCNKKSHTSSISIPLLTPDPVLRTSFQSEKLDRFYSGFRSASDESRACLRGMRMLRLNSVHLKYRTTHTPRSCANNNTKPPHLLFSRDRQQLRITIAHNSSELRDSCIQAVHSCQKVFLPSLPGHNILTLSPRAQRPHIPAKHSPDPNFTRLHKTRCASQSLLRTDVSALLSSASTNAATKGKMRISTVTSMLRLLVTIIR
jgi:hypothetical protein